MPSGNFSEEGCVNPIYKVSANEIGKRMKSKSINERKNLGKVLIKSKMIPNALHYLSLEVNKSNC